MDPIADRSRRGSALPLRAWMRSAGRVAGRARRDPLLLCRWAAHAWVLGLAAAVVLAGQSPSLASSPGGGMPGEPAAAAETAARRPTARGASGFLVRAAVPHTTISEKPAPARPAEDQAPAPDSSEARPLGIRTYTVQPGDTVHGLAQRLGISPDAILSANPSLQGNPDLLQLGQELQILPVSGVLHTVGSGETLSSIAQRYRVSVEAITGYKDNNLSDPDSLRPGQRLIVPGGTWPWPAAPAVAASVAPPQADPAYQATGRFIWPTTGVITQGVWWRHVAIDLGTPTGTPIYASDSGYVAEAGWSNVGYGLQVLLNHGNGFKTRYAHMSVMLVRAGQWVKKGQKIGQVGSTGNSTGPHLHFEIIKNGTLQNPFNYLP